MPNVTPSFFKTAFDKGMSQMNKIAAAGEGILKHSRPLKWGAAASLGLATLLSDPPQTMGPTQGSPSLANAAMKQGRARNVTPEDIGPPAASHGNPSAPQMGSNSTPMATNMAGASVSVRAKTRGNINPGSLSSSVRGALGGDSRVNVNYRDQRNTLTPQKIADILERG